MATGIRISDAAEFTRLLEALADDIIDAQIHHRLFKDLLGELRAHPLVNQQSRGFWGLTLQAHLNTCISALCRIFDQRKAGVLHLRSLLETIEENLHLFDDENFRERMEGNAFVDSLAERRQAPSRSQLLEDIELCSRRDKLVKTLWVHRGSRIVHRNAKLTIAGKKIGDQYPFTYEDVEILLDRAHTLINRYSYLFRASMYSNKMIGADDYSYIFKSVEENVKRGRERSAKLLKNAKSPPEDTDPLKSDPRVESG